MTPITLKELKKLVSPTQGQKLPTAKALRESNSEVVAEAAIGAHGELRVYQSGFYSYETANGATVYAVDRCGEYRYEGGDALDKTVLEDMDWTVSLMLAGEDRLEHNQIQREENDHFSYSHDVVEGSDLRDPFDFVAALEEKESIDRMLAVLTEKQRKLVLLHFVKGATHREIASQIGISHQAVTKAIRLAIEQMKKSF